MSFIESKTKLLKNKLASLVFIKSCKKVVIHEKYGSDYPVYGHLSRFIYIFPWHMNSILCTFRNLRKNGENAVSMRLFAIVLKSVVEHILA